MYIILDPLQPHPLVQQTHISRRLSGAMQGEETKSANAVVNGNHNDWLAMS